MKIVLTKQRREGLKYLAGAALAVLDIFGILHYGAQRFLISVLLGAAVFLAAMGIGLLFGASGDA